MSQDILFKTDEFLFSYRVAGLLLKNNKVLLQRPLDGKFYGIESIENNAFKLEFSWVDLKDLANIELYPTNAKELLINATDGKII